MDVLVSTWKREDWDELRHPLCGRVDLWISFSTGNENHFCWQNKVFRGIFIAVWIWRCLPASAPTADWLLFGSWFFCTLVGNFPNGRNVNLEYNGRIDPSTCYSKPFLSFFVYISFSTSFTLERIDIQIDILRAYLSILCVY